MSYFDPQNPGTGGLDELTDAEELFIGNLVNLAFQNGDILYYNSGALQRLAIGSPGDVLTVSAGLPSWQTGGASGITIEVPTGTVDDSNADFVFSEKPFLIVMNGSVYRENKGWTWSVLTATMSSPAGTGGDVYGIMT